MEHVGSRIFWLKISWNEVILSYSWKHTWFYSSAMLTALYALKLYAYVGGFGPRKAFFFCSWDSLSSKGKNNFSQ